ncbi:TetR/AcrR family transcriptional regulator [Pseudactinotalea sp. HY160]|uniref:TetR/AcrR family transcriptional regulator n=1 Tax=Pseudactinotalea sp. HY160 TaxID=2654490 RepID=UPI0018845F6A
MPLGKERRQAAARAEIVGACWELAREHGLSGFTMRQIAAAVGVQAPSLYTYFESKHAIYDFMFTEGNAAFRDAMRSVPTLEDRREQLRVAARAFVDFCLADPVRFQLLFQRMIPGFVPSPQAYAPAVEAFESMRAAFARIDITRSEDLDLWTALVTGLVSQQLANDPDGDRWLALTDAAADMFAAGLECSRFSRQTN